MAGQSADEPAMAHLPRGQHIVIAGVGSYEQDSASAAMR